MRAAPTLIVLTLLSALPLRAVTPPPIERVEIRGKSLWVNGEIVIDEVELWVQPV